MSDERRTANDELAAFIAERARAESEHARSESEHARSESEHGGDASPDGPAQHTRPYLLLRVGAHWFGLHAEAVREVVGLEAITRVPGQPAHIRGVALVHSRLVPVVSLELLLRSHAGTTLAEPDAAAARRRLIVVAEEERELALGADDARGVLYLAEARRGEGIAPGLLLGEITWDEQLVGVLDASTLLSAALPAGSAS
ncbi:chemotaxis protein CheW [Haliangium ochraceum]|uniref:CheW protein n=1 Tax=Haliangium ochraceum (strain DSM 14365 / JCM 11303 / SMP-2) TaxID=502025 RepID=D0LUC5_HALO1|nr:chemotaxis protein CheW [Haliangium ochraceum]ACY19248.1 CheW protein [Haliangium ochraceum DSM 14365]